MDNSFWFLSQNEKMSTQQELSLLSTHHDDSIYFKRGEKKSPGNVSSPIMKDNFVPGQFTNGSILDAFLMAFKSVHENNVLVQKCYILDHGTLLNLEQKQSLARLSKAPLMLRSTYWLDNIVWLTKQLIKLLRL